MRALDAGILEPFVHPAFSYCFHLSPFEAIRPGARQLTDDESGRRNRESSDNSRSPSRAQRTGVAECVPDSSRDSSGQGPDGIVPFRGEPIS